MIAWRIGGKIIRTVLCVLYTTVVRNGMHAYVSSSYRTMFCIQSAHFILCSLSYSLYVCVIIYAYYMFSIVSSVRWA